MTEQEKQVWYDALKERANQPGTYAVTGASRTGTCGVSSGTAETGGLPDSRTQNAPISITAPPKMTPAAAAARFLTHLFHGNTSPTVSFTY